MGADGGSRTALARLHPVAFENPAAGRRQSVAILLEALLHGHVVAEDLSAEMISIPRAGTLFLGRAGVLCQSRGRPKQHQHQQCESGHRQTPQLRLARLKPAASCSQALTSMMSHGSSRPILPEEQALRPGCC